MNKDTLVNMGLSLAFVGLSLWVAVFACNNPGIIAPASNAAISALSIIFGLSIAVSALPVHRGDLASRLSNDPAMGKNLARKVENDNVRTLFRQKQLTWLALMSIVSGLVYLVIFKHNPDGGITKIIAAAFSGLTSATLLFTLFLPGLLSTLGIRNAYIDNTTPK